MLFRIMVMTSCEVATRYVKSILVSGEHVFTGDYCSLEGLRTINDYNDVGNGDEYGDENGL